MLLPKMVQHPNTELLSEQMIQQKKLVCSPAQKERETESCIGKITSSHPRIFDTKSFHTFFETPTLTIIAILIKKFAARLNKP